MLDGIRSTAISLKFGVTDDADAMLYSITTNPS